MECKLSEWRVCETDASGAVTGATLRYVVRAESDAVSNGGAEILQLALKSSPDTIGDAVKELAAIVASPGHGSFAVEVRYRRVSGAEERGGDSDAKAGDESWRFDCGGAKRRIYEAVKLRKVVVSADAPECYANPGKLIGWNGGFDREFDVAGADIIVPEARESCVKIHSVNEVNPTMKKRIMELTGCVNSRNFHSYSAGEVLFLGASFGKVFFNRRGEKLVSVRYDFAIRANRSDTLVGELALGAVDGWEYVWSIPHADSGAAKVDYDAAVVDRIYPTADLGTLGIGKGR